MSLRKVDPYVYVMEWIWRHSQAESVTRYVLLRIGRAMRWTPDGFETGPLPTKEIAKDTGLGDSTVREHIGRLGALDGDLEVFKSPRRGETYRYRLRREQALPLTDMEPAPHRRMAAVSPLHAGGDSPPGTGGVTAELQQCDRSDAAVTPPNGGGDSSTSPSFSEVVRTEVLVPSTTYEQEVAGFLEWFHVEYLTRRGFPYRVKHAAAERVVRELLRDRSVERLQAMARLMFDAAHDEFIVTSDYSLFVLEHKATYLEGIVVANARRESTG